MNHLFKPCLILLSLLFASCSAVKDIAQYQPVYQGYSLNQPALVVGITVDQMRFDYLTKYWDDYSDEGFKRLIAEGFLCKNHHFSYAPTYTGPGHASIYTGTTPANHGIVGNNWYDRATKRGVYCSEDSTVFGIGDTTTAGEMSPKNMIVSTITDELKLFSNMRSKTIGISIKDRGAILPAGHMADAAYWFTGNKDGNFISSSYYMEELPNWVAEFNTSGYKDSLLATGWELLKPAESYEESIEDNNPYEAKYSGKLQPTFPYNFSELADSNGYYNLIKGSPLGNELVTDFALQCIKNEQLGKDQYCDFLAMSFSSTDYVGHQFAPTAIESQDTYLRLDLQIAKLLQRLDNEVGFGNYTIFLTADHGAVHNPNYLKKNGIPAGYFKGDQVTMVVDTAVKKAFGVEGIIESYSNNQLFLSDSVITTHHLIKAEVEQVVSEAALTYEGVFSTLTRTQLLNTHYTSGVNEILQEGFNQKLSGDVLVVPRPAWMSYPTTGTSHGSPFNYDTHVPLLFYGYGITPGFTNSETHIKDIAPTVAALLGIQMPNATTGSPILPVIGQ
ncbi:MAG: alkaline phosphatase PafA [Flavobacteriales bacterium]